MYTGTAGRVENCQVGVFAAYVTPDGSRALIDRELYLPEKWTDDRDRCRAAGIGDDVLFATKPELAWTMISRARDAGIPFSWVAGDEVYGGNPKLRARLEEAGRSGSRRAMRAGAQITNPCDRLESGDHPSALAAGQRADHGRLTVTLDGQPDQQIAHWRKYLGWKFGRGDIKADREIIGVYHDLQHAGEQEVASPQGPALPGNQYDVTCGAGGEQPAHLLQRPGCPVPEGRRAKCGFGVVGAAVVGRVIRRCRRHPCRTLVVRVSTVQRRDLRRHREKLRSQDDLSSQVTGKRSDGHLGQGTRLSPLVADLGPLDQVQRDRSCDRKHAVESGHLVAHPAILAAQCANSGRRWAMT